MYGWCSVFIFILLVSVIFVLFGKISFVVLLEYLLLLSLLLILISYLIFVLSYYYLLRNIFVFIFVVGFFNAGVTGSLYLLFNFFYIW